MRTVNERLRLIRDRMASEIYTMGLPPADLGSLPDRDPALTERIERVLNMTVEEVVYPFDPGMKQAIDRALFRLKYAWFFRWRMRFFEVIEHGASTICRWAATWKRR